VNCLFEWQVAAPTSQTEVYPANSYAAKNCYDGATTSFSTFQAFDTVEILKGTVVQYTIKDKSDNVGQDNFFLVKKLLSGNLGA
jgi:hypothetical protein